MNLPPSVSPRENVAYHDWILGPRGLLKFERTAQGVELVGDTALVKSFGITKDPFDFTQQELNDYKSYNPNILTILDVPMLLLRFHDEYDFFFLDLFPKDSDYWIRDANGNRVTTPFGESLIDFTHPEVQDIIIQIAVAVDNSGIWDGIFFDIWDETRVVLKGYRTLEAEQSARTAILEGIRNTVSDDFLILVNGNWKTAKNAASYINGLFWESFRGESLDNYSYESMKWFEKNLLWAENNLREPRMNSLEAEGIGNQSPLSRENQRAMRCITTLNLTHSDGFVLYTMGVQWNEPHQHDATFRSPFVDHLSDINYGHGQDPQGLHHTHHHQHYWYDFWDADLGQPVSKKGQHYQGIEGLFIREFTNGWAVYNRSGKERKIYLPEKVSGVASGVVNKHWHTIPDLDGEIFLKQMTPTPEPSIGTQNRYDVDGDGDVDVSDLRLVVIALGQKDKNITNPRTDVNKNNKVDKNDVLLVIDNLDDANGSPLNTDQFSPISEETMHLLNPTILRSTLKALRLENDGSLKYQQAIALLESILAALRPDATQLLANYPNPFNPETWIPYHLATDTDVEIRIYDTRGILVRSLALGHQRAGIYSRRERAVYWDGRNDVGERVASGVYFYQLQTDAISPMRKMVILK